MGPLTTVKGKTYIGIDLGTTYSAMAYLDGEGRPVTIPNGEGDTTTPSVVLFQPDGSVIVGHEARLAALSDPTGSAECVKRDIGEAHFSRQINGKQLAPEAISSLIIKKLKQDAQRVLGPVTGAVITVPAYFDERRRQATVTAGTIAGLEVLDIINEPTAASLAFALRDYILKDGKPDDELRLAGEKVPSHNALVYDLGGGTFDVTLLSISGNRIVVLATDGDVYLGGLDWDQRIADFAAEQFKTQFNADPRTNPRSNQNLAVAAQQAKHNLSRSIATKVRVSHEGHSATYDLTRDQFEQMTVDLLYRTENRLSRVIKAAQMEWTHIEQVLAVGGSTRMPQVLAMLERVTGHKPNTSLPPDEVVAHGAAVHAAITLRQVHPSKRKGATNVPMDDSTTQGLPAIPDGNQLDSFEAHDQPAPTAKPGDSAEMLIDTDDAPALLDDDARQATGEGTAVEMQLDEDPNEMTQVLSAIKTTNVNAHSLGVALKREDGVAVNSTVIPRNTPLPASVTKRYGTNVPNQVSVSVHVLEGESKVAEECIHVGTCRITNLPWGLRKGSTIYVTFSYDNSGRIEVKAVEATSGKSATTTLQRDGAMNAEQVDKVRQAVERITVT